MDPLYHVFRRLFAGMNHLGSREQHSCNHDPKQ